MQQHRVICKEIREQLQRMCFDKPIAGTQRPPVEAVPSSRELGVPDLSKVSP